MGHRQKVSIIAPVRNQAGSLPALYEGLNAACHDLACQFQFLFVDDGSKDRTDEELARLRVRDRRVEYVLLMRSFGWLSALEAGAAHATGDAIIVWDTESSFPMTLISDMVAHWQSGVDVVHVRGGKENAWGAHCRQVGTPRRLLKSLLGDFSSEPVDRSLRLVSQDVIRRLRDRSAAHWLRGSISTLVGIRQAEIVSAATPHRVAETERASANDLQPTGSPLSSFPGTILSGVVLLSLLTGLAGVSGGLALLVGRLLGYPIAGNLTWLLACVLLFGGIQLAVTGAIASSILKVLSGAWGGIRYAVRQAVVTSPQEASQSLN